MLGASGASIWCFSPKLEIGSHANDSSNHIESSSNHPKIILKSPASAAQSSDFRRLGDLGSASQRNHQLRQLLGQRPIDLSLLLLSCLHLQRQPQGDHYAKWWEMTTFKPHQTSSLIFLRFSPLSSAVLAAWPCGENTTSQQKTWWSLRMPPAKKHRIHQRFWPSGSCCWWTASKCIFHILRISLKVKTCCNDSSSCLLTKLYDAHDDNIYIYICIW